MRLYKFRSLGKEEHYEYLKDILDKGFRCSKFWELNDPMEGLFTAKDEESIQRTWDGKKKYRICSFSGENGFKNPLLWGYYANGFRGVAIEIEVTKKDIKNIHQMKYISSETLEKSTSNVIEILTRKLRNWEHEDEFRFLKKIEEDEDEDQTKFKIGTITRIHFGNPYGCLGNSTTITEMEPIKDYLKFKENIIKDIRKYNKLEENKRNPIEDCNLKI